MIVAQQCLHDGQIDAGLGQRRPESVPQRMRVAGGHSRAGAVVAKDRPQPRGREGLPARRALGDDDNAQLAVSGRSVSR